MADQENITIISETIEVHPSAHGYSVVRNGQVYGEYESYDYAVELAQELAEGEGE